MTMKKIHAKDVLPLLHKAVEDRGADWTYPDVGDCLYAYVPEEYDRYSDEDDYPGAAAMVAYFGDTFGPACLVGYVLNALDPAWLTTLIDKDENGQSVDGLHLQGGWNVGEDTYVFTDKAVAVLRAAQLAQDDKHPWGEAFKAAEGVCNVNGVIVEVKR